MKHQERESNDRSWRQKQEMGVDSGGSVMLPQSHFLLLAPEEVERQALRWQVKRSGFEIFSVLASRDLFFSLPSLNGFKARSLLSKENANNRFI